MTQKIPASAIAGITNFAVAAASHAVETKAWRAHMARVADDQRNDVPIERRHVAYPRPRAHPMIERAIDENDEVNFEVIDDGPTAAELLAARKTELLNAGRVIYQRIDCPLCRRWRRRWSNFGNAWLWRHGRRRSGINPRYRNRRYAKHWRRRGRRGFQRRRAIWRQRRLRHRHRQLRDAIRRQS
jgi:hypothetical protein